VDVTVDDSGDVIIVGTVQNQNAPSEIMVLKYSTEGICCGSAGSQQKERPSATLSPWTPRETSMRVARAAPFKV
jgi:hypothetical protein